MSRSTFRSAGLVGVFRCNTESWCRSTRISASNDARDRNHPITANQINRPTSIIGGKYHLIRSYQPAV